MEDTPNDKKIELATKLVEAEAFDHFLHKKFITFKRYSGEGAESTVVALNQLFDTAAQSGYEHIVFGMPHRGRFNVLTTFTKTFDEENKW